MPQTVTKIATLGAELSSYSATFTARGLTLAGEQRSNLEYAVTATRANGALAGVAHGPSVKDACNALAAQVGIPGNPVF